MLKRELTLDEVLVATSGSVDMHVKKRRRLEKLDNDQLIAYQLRTLLINACRDLDPKKAYDLYKQARSEGLVPAVDASNHVMCLLAGLGEPGSGCNRNMDPGSHLLRAVEIFMDAKKAGINIHEPSYSALVRSYCSNNQALEALELFNELLSLNLTPKHRTFTPLLDALSRGHHSVECFDLFNSMLGKHELIPLEKDYTSMLRLCLETNDGRFVSLLEAMMEDVLVPVLSETTDVIRSWFMTQRAPPSNQPLYSVHDATPGAKGEFDSSAWGCGEGPEYCLRSIDLSESQREGLLEQINAAAMSRATNPRGRKPDSTAALIGAGDAVAPAAAGAAISAKPRSAKMIVEVKFSCATWDAFLDWIRDMDASHQQSAAPAGSSAVYRSQGPYDVLIDGANVGYYKQNYAGAPAHIDYFQVDAMIRYLQSTGRRVLLVLHCRHLHPATVPAECVDVVRSWADEGVLLTAPAGSNDDWFWLYAALHWRCQVATNDEMRDHHFRMLSPRYFNRWKERNQIHFSFEGGRLDGSTVGDSLGKKRIKLATDTAASVVHEQFYIRDRHEPKTTNTSATNTDAVVIGAKRSHDEAALGADVEKPQKVLPLTHLRRRNIILHVPMYYSNRMQKSPPSAPLAYYFPLVETVESPRDNDVVSTDTTDDDGTMAGGLHPIVPPPALVVGDNAVPVVSKWMCCVAVSDA